MKNFTRCQALVAAAALFAASAANAVVITFDSQLDDDNVSTTTVAGATVIDFNDLTCGAYAACFGDGVFAIGDEPGVFAAPYVAAAGADDTTRYVSVPYAQSSGAAQFVLGTTANYFGLLWGSIDDYNTLEFLYGGIAVATFTGLDINNPADGNQTLPATNQYVNFFDLPIFDTVRMTSTQYAFESDNHAYATVPEPGTLVLLGAGLLGLALVHRRPKLAASRRPA